ncbi:MAG: transcriptional regulator GcvA [Alphaproteobacteria bacterium]|nr:transcriptional regulator GcvA [Alphaproteobacteria bacterium]
MSRKLPPLNAVRAFEAAARHLSFTAAASELHVTQAAISHQIRMLEERLGLILFRRSGRGVLLTDAAQAYLPEVSAAFDRLAAATQRLRAQDGSGVLSATVLPSFAAKWLLPRLGRFRAAHPDIDLRISSSPDLVDLSRGEFDIAIRAGSGDYPGMRSDFISKESFFPVCSPALLAAGPPLREPRDLRHYTLLHDEPRDLWRIWFTLVGVTDIDASRGPGFSDSSMVIWAAVEGQGVAIARSALAADDLAAGRLVRPFDQSVPGTSPYWLVCPEAIAERPKIVAFREWLLAEARASAEMPGGGGAAQPSIGSSLPSASPRRSGELAKHSLR